MPDSAIFFDDDMQVATLDNLARTYGKRPSEIIGLNDPIQAIDFDVTVMYVSERIRDGEIKDPIIIKKKQRAGVESLKALQNKVIKVYETGKK